MSGVFEIPGESNWELKIQTNGNRAAILSAFTGERKAILPDEINGVPVTAIEAHALAPGHLCNQGDAVRITYGAERPQADNTKLEVLTLPRELRTLGSYALMNCRQLKTIRLYDKIEFIGISPFMNCHEMKEVHFLKTENGSWEALYYILSSMPQEFDISVFETDGTFCRFIIPEYYELLEENEPTHFFNMTIEGGGYPYHAVFGRNGFRVEDYDELFPNYIKGYYEKTTALRMAYYRLKHSAGLSDAARERYLHFLLGIAEDALAYSIEQRDIRGLEMLVAEKPGSEHLKTALCHARSTGYTEAVALLLEATRSEHPRRSREYEL